jgi:hypothetical protein
LHSPHHACVKVERYLGLMEESVEGLLEGNVSRDFLLASSIFCHRLKIHYLFELLLSF